MAIGTSLAATLLTLCIGLQILEATGQWDRTFQDTGDEAIVVTVTLCVGAAVAVARAARRFLILAPLHSLLVRVSAAAVLLPAPSRARLALGISPPLSLRI